MGYYLGGKNVPRDCTCTVMQVQRSVGTRSLGNLPWKAGAEARCCCHSISRVRSEETDAGLALAWLQFVTIKFGSNTAWGSCWGK